MREIQTKIDIDAPPRVVWQTLTDLRSYSEWNPHIVEAEGDHLEGSTVELRIERAEAKPRSMTVTVTDCDRYRRLRWVGHVVHPRLFEGRHTFELALLNENKTRLYNSEKVSGLLAPFVVSDDTARDYEAMNEALAERAERRAAAAT
ncbi:SRPBCC domain-containing protein [Halorussus halophilus]|uniref:SRPBCC domain-containing protein n=1 Tax=Halorussus halophilus TaxID=2650975 RepID=UPI0013017838|nr:SRPBCC domain-containing protein [Halorussus halophilus]